MPNQLSGNKRRKTVAEHSAVLAALGVIAEFSGVTVTDLVRAGMRETIRSRVGEHSLTDLLNQAVRECAPKSPDRCTTPAQLSRFKRELREFDALLIELGLDSSEALQSRNSIHLGSNRPRLVSAI